MGYRKWTSKKFRLFYTVITTNQNKYATNLEISNLFMKGYTAKRLRQYIEDLRGKSKTGTSPGAPPANPRLTPQSSYSRLAIKLSRNVKLDSQCFSEVCARWRSTSSPFLVNHISIVAQGWSGISLWSSLRFLVELLL